MDTDRPAKRAPEDVTAGVIHHNGKTGRDPSAEELNRYAIEVKEYAGIGYHFVMRRDGTIEEGRPLDAWGAHVQGHNDYSIGICVNGNLEEEDITKGQYEALLLLGWWLQEEFERLATWHPHCELEPTLCPGANFPWKEFDRKMRR